jgi:hypothetical protein
VQFLYFKRCCTSIVEKNSDFGKVGKTMTLDLSIAENTATTELRMLRLMKDIAEAGPLNVTNDIYLLPGSGSPEPNRCLFKKGKLTLETITNTIDLYFKKRFRFDRNLDIFSHLEFENLNREKILDKLYDDLKIASGSMKGLLIETEELIEDLFSIINKVDLGQLTLIELAKMQAYAPDIHISNIQSTLLSMKLTEDMRFWQDEKEKKRFVAAAGLGSLCKNISMVEIGIDGLYGMKREEMEPNVWLRVKDHPIESATIFINSVPKDRIDNWIIQKSKEAIIYHHERLDGKGYYHKKGPQIPILSQILGLAESYVSMTCADYKKKMRVLTAVSELQKCALPESVFGQQFDPYLVSILSSYVQDSVETATYTAKEKTHLVINYSKLNREMKKLDYIMLGKKMPKIPYIDDIILQYTLQ